MAKTFQVPKSPSKSILNINTFIGADFTNSPTMISENQSPNCENFIRDVPGKVRKCMGYEFISNFGNQKINGFYDDGNGRVIVHAGQYLYRFVPEERNAPTPIYGGLPNEKSFFVRMGEYGFILTGQKIVVIMQDGTYHPLTVPSDRLYTPIIAISKRPNGGGTPYEPLNMLSTYFTDSFLGTETDTDYYLSFTDLDNFPITVKVMNEQGIYQTVAESAYTVDRANGIIHFASAPGVSPITGEDNVRITASKAFGNAQKIDKAKYGIAFGVSGSRDRLFLTDGESNRDYFSEYNNPFYFPDTYYCEVGSAKSKIVGYAVVSNKLVTYKDENENGQNIVIREGTLTNENVPLFRTVNTLQGVSACAPFAFDYLDNEPLCLTKSGVYAITTQDITGEKYTQCRSFYINGKLLSESDLQEAYSCVYDDMYWLLLNGKCYILDGLQPISSDRQMPFSTRQYACFLRTNIPANIIFTYQDRLWFGDFNGNVYRFYKDKNALASYNDNGAPIHCVWETPDFDGKLFYKNKTFRYMAVRLGTAIATSLKISAMKNGLWTFIKEDNTTGRYFKFSELMFSKFTFSNNRTERVMSTKLRIKKVDKARFRIENDELNEPFIIHDVAFEYVENGNFR